MTTATTTPPPLMLCRPTNNTATSTTKPSAIPPAFVVDSNGRKLFRSSCRARAVAKDHTPATAYLLIPEDVRHGYLLRCSHSWCIKTGRLFRYCVVCRQPVTKRNFHKRHGHGLIRYEEGRSIFPADEEPEAPSAVEPPVSSSLPAVVIGGDCTKPLDAGAILLVGTEEATGVSARGNIVSDEDSSAAAGAQPVVSDSGGRIATTVSPEEMAWLQLFRERPATSTHEEATKKWYSSIASMCYPGEQRPEPAPVAVPPPATEERVEALPLKEQEGEDDYKNVGLDSFDIGFDEANEGRGTELDDEDLDFLLDRNYEIV